MLKNHKFWIHLLLTLFLLAGSFWVGLTIAGKGVANAQAEVSSESPVTVNGGSRFVCQVDSVAVFQDRIHIRCNPANGNIAFFAHATDTAHAQDANRMLVLANTAYALGKSVYADYIDDPAFNPSGCQISDCRLLTAITLLP